ncbi:hypothetical protein BURK1_01936 [Burkholderiales bacterium]|nr:hypothetical protein BURK1_01936 [Burkholderiales bacterium]
MIFRNPSGAPELGCDACGCRWFDRMTDTCYECGTPIPAAEARRFVEAAEAWQARSGAKATPAAASEDGGTD